MTLSGSQIIFLLALAALGAQRIFEMRLSNKNASALLTSGGIEYAPWQASAMKILHSLWFAGIVAEVTVLGRTFELWMLSLLPVFVLGQILRYLAIKTLGPRWCIRVFALPQKPPISSGLYSWIRHPNYLGVVLEIASFPMLHGAWITSTVFSVANGVLLFFRIKTENQVLYIHAEASRR